MTTSSSAALAAAVLIGSVFTMKVSETRDQDIQIYVKDGRPLAAAIVKLEEQSGWVITYEDPQWLHDSEIDDVTTQVRRDGALTPKVLVPKGGTFAFVFPQSRLTDVAPAAKAQTVVDALLDAYRASGSPGEFRSVRTGEIFHVVPTAVTDRSGHTVEYRSLLDARISLPAGDRNVMDDVNLILIATSNASGHRLAMGTIPTNLFMQRQVHGGATAEVARDVLVRTLLSTGSKLSWRLLCEPGEDKFCVLNVPLLFSR